MTTEVKVHNSEQFTEHNVSSELWREYVYPNGDELLIKAPKKLFLKRDEEGHSHRIVDAFDITWYPRRGWICIRWSADPNVSF